MDRIVIHGAHFYGRHGVSEEERRVGGHYTVDIEMSYDLAAAGASDDLRDTISYSDVFRAAREIVEGTSFHLIEALAEQIATMVLSRFPAQAVLVRVKKEPPPIAGAIDYAGVEIVREQSPRKPSPTERQAG